MLRRAFLSALVVASLVSGLSLPTSAQAQTPKTKILFLTESKGFVHGSVNRNVKDGQKKDLAASEVAMTQLGQQTGLFSIHCTQDSKADFTKENLKNYDIVVHPDCRHAIDELTLYAYKVDPLTNEVLPVLIDAKNHVIDALRYAVEGTRRAADPGIRRL